MTELLKITADEARGLTSAAKTSREAAESAAEVQRERDIVLRHNEVMAHINSEISVAAQNEQVVADYIYQERIAKGRNSPAAVERIKSFADEVSSMVVTSLEDSGYTVKTATRESLHFTQGREGDKPEWYETDFRVSWSQEG